MLPSDPHHLPDPNPWGAPSPQGATAQPKHHHSHPPLPCGMPGMVQVGPLRSHSPFGVNLAQPTCPQSPGGTGHLEGAHPRETSTAAAQIPLPLLAKPCLELNCSRATISLLLCQGRCQERCQSSPGLPRCCLTFPKHPNRRTTAGAT